MIGQVSGKYKANERCKYHKQSDFIEAIQKYICCLDLVQYFESDCDFIQFSDNILIDRTHSIPLEGALTQCNEETY